VTNGRNGFKPRVEISQEPIIDDIDDDAAYLASFIEEETNEALGTPENPTPASQPEPAPDFGQPVGEQRFALSNADLSAAIAPELSSQQDKLLLDFPSLSDLQSLASELLNLGNTTETVKTTNETVTASNPREKSEGEKSHGEGNYIMDDEES
jgi:hypothetical protein